MDFSRLYEKSVGLYLKDVWKLPLLNPEDEKKEFRKMHHGDDKAREKLIEANLRFVVKIAKEYVNRGVSFCDLINAGNIGLIKAVDRFDEKRGFKLISYAVWWIRQGMLRTIIDNGKAFRLPVNRFGVVNNLRKISDEITQSMEREPMVDEIAEKLGISVDEVKEAKGLAKKSLSLNQNCSSLEDLEDNDTEFLIDLIPDKNHLPDKNITIKELSDDLFELLQTLSEREKNILFMYFGLDGKKPLTLKEIGCKINVSEERVRQIKEKALQRLKHPTRSRKFEVYCQD